VVFVVAVVAMVAVVVMVTLIVVDLVSHSYYFISNREGYHHRYTHSHRHISKS
jgi:hypothetical protein